MEGTNNVGDTLIISSDGVVIDLTPPQTGSVIDGMEGIRNFEPGVDMQFQTAAQSLFATWDECLDSTSGIDRLEVSVVTDSGRRVHPWEQLHAQPTSYGLLLKSPLVPGIMYHFEVLCVNGAGLQAVTRSDGVIVDLTPPTVTWLRELSPDADADFITTEFALLSAYWAGGDDESGITKWEWAVGTYPGGFDVVDFESVGTRTSGVSFSIVLQNAWRFYVTVRGFNGAGMETSMTGDGVLADFMPPVIGAVVDGWDDTDVDYSTSPDTVFVSWRWTQDAESGIQEFLLGVGTTAFSTDVVRPVRIDSGETRAKLTGLALESSAVTLYAVLKAVDFAGHESTAASNGFIVDTTPPIELKVRDGVADTPDLDYVTSASIFTANWEPSADVESGLSTVEFGIGAIRSCTQPRCCSTPHPAPNTV